MLLFVDENEALGVELPGCRGPASAAPQGAHPFVGLRFPHLAVVLRSLELPAVCRVAYPGVGSASQMLFPFGASGGILIVRFFTPLRVVHYRTENIGTNGPQRADGSP